MSSEKILLVDDNDGQRITLERILNRSGFNVMSANCGTAALSIAKENEFAAALLDIKMPDITGIDVLKELKITFPDLKVFMLTASSETEYAIDALNAGATAYILKPANIEHVKSLLSQAIEHQRLVEENRAMATALREWNIKLEEKVKTRTEQLTEAYRVAMSFYGELKKNFDSTLEVLSIAIDERDHLTSSHSFRVTEYAQEIGKVMGLGKEDLEKLRYAGLMHDLGKIEIKEKILCKEGSLTSEEYHEIQSHAQGTFDLLSRFKFKRNLADVPLIASSHHERFDGEGYPLKLKGDKIPLLSRVLSAADVLDAITSKRHYRTAMPINEALNVMKRESGGHFDPQVIKALFMISASQFLKIHMAEYLDRLNPTDLIELTPTTLQNIDDICSKEEPTSTDLACLQLLCNYYQGPVPSKFETTLKPAPKFDPTL